MSWMGSPISWSLCFLLSWEFCKGPWEARWFHLRAHPCTLDRAGRGRARAPARASSAVCWIERCRSSLPSCMRGGADGRCRWHAYELDSAAVLSPSVISIQTTGSVPAEVSDEFVCRRCFLEHLPELPVFFVLFILLICAVYVWNAV